MATFEWAFAFNWEIPATLLYKFVRITEDRSETIPVEGSALSDGRFLIDEFAKSNDSFRFQLYEWTMDSSTTPQNLHSKPQRFRLHTENFDRYDLFRSQPKFGSEAFYDRAEPVTEKSPFEGLQNLYKWIQPPFDQQAHIVTQLSEQQIFRIQARLVVPSLPDTVSARRKARIFFFDPEMAVGDDGGGPGATSTDGGTSIRR